MRRPSPAALAFILSALIASSGWAARSSGPQGPGPVDISLPAGAVPAPALPGAAPVLPSSVIPSAGAAVEGAAPTQPGPAAQLKGIAADSGAAKADSKAGRRFDGAKPRNGVQDEEDVPIDGSGGGDEEPAEQPEELRFTRHVAKLLYKDELDGSIRFLRSAGSEWHWNKFKKGTLVRIVTGGNTIVLTRVTSAETKQIKDLTLTDLRGILPGKKIEKATTVGRGGRKRVNLNQLRQSVIEDIGFFNRGTVITTRSKVRVLHFIPYKKARATLPENRMFEPLEPTLEPRARNAVSVPAGLADLHKYLPKVVVIDLRLFREKVPFELLEDMGKLMKAGVYFVTLSDRRQDGPGSVEELLTKRLTPRERDQFVRHKLINLSDDGNSLIQYHGAYPARLPVRRFTGQQLDLMQYMARAEGLEVLAARGTEFSLAAPDERDAESLAAYFSDLLSKYGLPRDYSVKIGAAADGRRSVTLRPSTLDGAIPHLLEVLQDELGLFINMSDVMAVSRDPGVLKALKGALVPSALAPRLDGEELVETSLAALLGPYRENIPNDFASSASKISSFLRNRGGGGGSYYNINMLMGHVMHSAFNWAIWVYRNTGKFPDADALVARAERNWNQEEMQEIRNLVTRKGENKGGYLKAVRARMREMHSHIVDHLLANFPIVLGTELPNLYVFERYKRGELVSRDILRLIFDFVVARRVRGGLEYWVVDFKTGQTSTLQPMAKDIQVQLYDAVPRLMWDHLHEPYGLTGEARKTVNNGVGFIFPPGIYEPTLNDWSREGFSNKFLRNAVNRMRKQNAPPAPAAEKGRAKKAKRPKGKKAKK